MALAKPSLGAELLPRPLPHQGHFQVSSHKLFSPSLLVSLAVQLSKALRSPKVLTWPLWACRHTRGACFAPPGLARLREAQKQAPQSHRSDAHTSVLSLPHCPDSDLPSRMSRCPLNPMSPCIPACLDSFSSQLANWECFFSLSLPCGILPNAACDQHRLPGFPNLFHQTCELFWTSFASWVITVEFYQMFCGCIPQLPVTGPCQPPACILCPDTASHLFWGRCLCSGNKQL